jgi:hypothetical protein
MSPALTGSAAGRELEPVEYVSDFVEPEILFADHGRLLSHFDFVVSSVHLNDVDFGTRVSSPQGPGGDERTVFAQVLILHGTEFMDLREIGDRQRRPNLYHGVEYPIAAETCRKLPEDLVFVLIDRELNSRAQRVD